MGHHLVVMDLWIYSLLIDFAGLRGIKDQGEGITIIYDNYDYRDYFPILEKCRPLYIHLHSEGHGFLEVFG